MHKFKLCSFLWPQLDERQALINLQTTMYALRRKLADPLSDNLRIEYSENSYILRMTSFRFDYQDFLQLHRRWQDSHSPAIAEEALALGKEGLLESEGWTWAQPFQAGCDLKYLEMATWLVEMSYTEGRYNEVVQRVVEMVEQYEPWPSAQVAFVKAVCALYSPPEASAKLNDFRQQLTHRFGVGLAPEAASLVPRDGGE